MATHDDPWFEDPKKKREAIVSFLRHVWKNRNEGKACVGNDTKAHDLFEKHGNMKVPTNKGARVVVFESGEKKLRPASSVIIELPPENWPRSGKEPTDKQLLQFVIGNYVHW